MLHCAAAPALKSCLRARIYFSVGLRLLRRGTVATLSPSVKTVGLCSVYRDGPVILARCSDIEENGVVIVEPRDSRVISPKSPGSI